MAEADERSDLDDIEGRMLIEVESGYLISEKGASMFALGDAGIHLYFSKEKAEERHEQKLIKTY